MSVKINSFEVENVKRVKAVSMALAPNGLTVIGGRNGQGKTSVLDAIAWALGGEKLKPSEAARKGSTIPPHIHIELSNGLVVERKGKSGSLKVFDPSGTKAGQKLLDSFVERLALDLPKFMSSTSKAKADILLQIIGIGEELAAMERKESQLYNQRLEIGRIAKQKAAHAEELDSYPDVPSEPISASDLIQQQQAILAKNGENKRKRDNAAQMDAELEAAQLAFNEAKLRLETAEENAAIAHESAKDIIDESTAELEANIAKVDEINAKVRINMDKEKAVSEAEELKGQYEELTKALDAVKKEKLTLLDHADLPLPELSVLDGELTYKGQRWDCMSGAEQLMVATAIIRKLNPECGFVLMDKLEQMDQETLQEFGQWLEAEGLQVIATRVGTDDSCSIVIEDGYIKGATSVPEKKTWTPGKF